MKNLLIILFVFIYSTLFGQNYFFFGQNNYSPPQVLTSELYISSPVTDYAWEVPAGVDSICVVAVQGGQGGGIGYGGSGGDLAYANFIHTTPGETLYISSGAGGSAVLDTYGNTGGHSYIKRGAVTIFSTDGTGADVVYSGGSGAAATTTSTPEGDVQTGGGGGGAGGYSGVGGDGGGATGSAGAGGAGGGGAWHTGYYYILTTTYGYTGYNGGGVGLFGEGTSGASSSTVGRGGSGGNDAQIAAGTAGGGGGGSHSNSSSTYFIGVAGANGAIRIIWGEGRYFPSTNVWII